MQELLDSNEDEEIITGVCYRTVQMVLVTFLLV